MKRHNSFLSSLSVVLLFFVGLQISCTSDEKEEGLGQLKLQIGLNKEDIEVETKTATSQLDSCKVLIKNSNGDIIRKYDNATNMPTEEWLIAGRYIVEASLGTPKRAEYDHPCYAGKAEVYIVANRSISKEIVCKLNQSKVSVVYGKGVTSNFKDYTASVSMGTSKLEFKKDSTKIGYYYNNTEEKQNLVCSVKATPNSGAVVEYEKAIVTNMQPCTHYIVHVDYNTDVAEGGFKFEVEVNSLVDEKEDNVVVPISKYPVIKCDKQYVLALNGDIKSISLLVKGYPELSGIELSGSFLAELQLQSAVDLLNLEQSAKDELKNKGFIIGERTEDPTDQLKHQLVEVEIPVPVSTIYSKNLTIKVSDSKMQIRELKDISIQVTNMAVIASPVNEYEVWAKHATLRGKLKDKDKPTTVTIGFQYKKESDANWSYVEARKDNSDYFVLISNLSANTTYEYRITEGVDEDMKVGTAETFVTENAYQIPYMNFDDWFKDGKVWYLMKEGGEKWWDSGNKGTNTVGEANPTSRETDVVVRGNAAKLASDVVFSVFAAGNLYTGDFVQTFVSLTNPGAELNFGKPYTSRPSQLTGHYKYNPGKITNVSGKVPFIKKDDKDSCSIYIALCDWNAPFNVNTQKGTFVNLSDPSILAYGELSKDEMCPNGEMVDYKKFTIDLKYRTLKKKPTYILIVASASKYGDYFVGSTSSVLYLDEFELIFDDNIQIDEKYIKP